MRFSVLLWLSEQLPGVDLIRSTNSGGRIEAPRLYNFRQLWTLLLFWSVFLFLFFRFKGQGFIV